MHRIITLAVLIPVILQAQGVRVSGLAYDSLAHRTLPQALVTLGSRSTFTDSLGRFEFDSVAPGSYRATMQHDRLDSIGVVAITTTVVVRAATDTVRIATPSAWTMWGRVCPGAAPDDSGFVFGAVRTAKTRELVAGRPVVATWTDLNRAGQTVSQREYRLETTTGADGTFVLCGLPFDAGIRLSSSRDSIATAVEVSLSRATPVRRRDLTLIDATVHGIVRGVVTLKGQPLSNVRVSVGGAPEIRTGYTGRFAVQKVPAGTQIMDIQGIGFAPISQVVEVPVDDTVDVAIAVDKITVLDSVVVKAPTYAMRLQKEFDDRRLRGRGYFADSTVFGKENAIESIFASMKGVYARRPQSGDLFVQLGTREKCPRAWVYVDGKLSYGRLAGLRPGDLAAVEVYRTNEMPFELAGTLGLKPPATPCAVVAWTKLRMR